jgi:hypothetical protein
VIAAERAKPRGFVTAPTTSRRTRTGSASSPSPGSRRGRRRQPTPSVSWLDARHTPVKGYTPGNAVFRYRSSGSISGANPYKPVVHNHSADGLPRDQAADLPWISARSIVGYDDLPIDVRSPCLRPRSSTQPLLPTPVVREPVRACASHDPRSDRATFRRPNDRRRTRSRYLQRPSPASVLGLLLAEQGDVDAARSAWQQAIDSGYPDQAPTAMVNLAVLHDDDAGRS